MGATNSGQNRIFYKLKVEKETNVPIFIRQKKDSNGVWVTDQTFNQVTGYLKKIELDSYVWEGDNVETLKLIFDDDENFASNGLVGLQTGHGSEFQVETGFNYLSRSILNTLAGATNINHVLIRVYLGKPNDQGKSYPQAYLEINKTKAGWKYKPDEVPKAKEVKVGGKTLKDTSQVDEFFKLLLPEINAKIISEAEVNTEMKSQPTGSGKSKTSEMAPDPESDLPFVSPYFQKVPVLLRRSKKYVG